MKLKYQDKQVFSMLNEGLGVMIRQKKILKHPNKRVRGALTNRFYCLVI